MIILSPHILPFSLMPCDVVRLLCGHALFNVTFLDTLFSSSLANVFLLSVASVSSLTFVVPSIAHFWILSLVSVTYLADSRLTFHLNLLLEKTLSSLSPILPTEIQHKSAQSRARKNSLARQQGIQASTFLRRQQSSPGAELETSHTP